MMRSLRLSLLAATLCAGAAHAQLFQTQVGVPPALEVQRVAPQLVAFAGGDVNFANLVNGLALGLPVTLTTPLAPGVTQVVNFQPVGTLTPLQIAQTLETARQQAIANGIAAPSAQQLGIILNGGALPTALGTTNVNGLIGGNAGLATSLATGAAPAVQLQQAPRFARSDSPLPRGIADTPPTVPTGVNAGTPLAPATGSALAPSSVTPAARTGSSVGAAGSTAAGARIGR